MIQCVFSEFSYGCVSIHTPWLPPFVLCVCADDTSADRTNIKRGRRSSQAARSISYRRRISSFRTKSRISSPAWEVRVSAVPDFRLHPSSEIGSLIFCRLGQTKCQRTDPSKIPFSQTHINPTNRLQQYKVFAELFSKSDRIPFTPPQHSLHPFRISRNLGVPILRERYYNDSVSEGNGAVLWN